MQRSSSAVGRVAATRRPRIRWGQVATIVGFLQPAAII
jgi:hypothetical protein